MSKVFITDYISNPDIERSILGDYLTDKPSDSVEVLLVWHEYSQQLESLFRVTYALFIAKKEEMIKNRYVTSRKPYLFKCTPYESVDIDNLYDFKLAQLLYSNKSVFQNL